METKLSQLMDCSQPAQIKKPPRPQILLAEDNPINQEVAQTMLEDLGCRVDVATNGLEALQALVHHAYVLIFMDCQMPVMDGYAATKSIREKEGADLASSSIPRSGLQTPDSGLSRVPIIALTANVMQGDREKCLAAGMDDYIGKPFTQEQLRTILTRWLPPLSKQRGKADSSALSAPIRPASSSSPNSQPSEEASSILTPLSPPYGQLDPKALENLRVLQQQGAAGLLNRIIQRYLDHTPRLMHTLREALNQKDAAAVQKAAHSLKSSSANVGATTFAAVCRELELMGRTRAIDNASSLLVQLEAGYEAVQAALAAQLSQEAT